MKIDEYWLKSDCGNGWLHRFKLQQQWPDCVQEVCEICGQEEFFQVFDGRIDTLNYGDLHMRQWLMPQHPLYQREYPKAL